jgi:hypothetical protein
LKSELPVVSIVFTLRTSSLSTSTDAMCLSTKVLLLNFRSEILLASFYSLSLFWGRNDESISDHL